eukprot:COSAG04_NODE_23073_length_344_cov_0.926531_1_plen_27_part_10
MGGLAGARRGLLRRRNRRSRPLSGAAA